LYEDVSRETDLKTTTFTFPGKPGAYIQSHGRAGRRFPFTCIFAGTDCMEKADVFESALCEKGYGELRHPVYGVFKVVPTGTIKRSDKLVSGLNQSLVDIEFSETITDTDVPQSIINTESTIEETLSAMEDAAAVAFAADFAADDVSDAIQAQSIVKEQTHSLTKTLGALAKTNSSAWTEFQTIQRALESGIDAIFTNKLNTARMILNLTKTPARIVISATEKIRGYSRLVKQLINGAIRDPFGAVTLRNQFAATRLNLYAAIANVASGVALSSIQAGTSRAVFASREEAVGASDSILTLLSMIKDFQDAKTSKDVFVDTDAGYSELLAIVTASLDMIMNASFSLPTRRVITLDRDRQIIELAAELYNDIDRIDDLIAQNNLNADEIEILPMGKEIAYYVEVA
jgi:prophage DNA circulation protein